MSLKHYLVVVLFLTGGFQSALGGQSSNPFILCGDYQPLTSTLNTKAGEKIQINNLVATGAKKGASTELCLFAETAPTENSKTISTLPYVSAPKEVRSGGWSSLKCGYLRRENSQLYLVTENASLSLQFGSPVQIEEKGAYCVYSNKIPVRDLNGDVRWDVEKISLEGMFSSGVTVGN